MRNFAAALFLVCVCGCTVQVNRVPSEGGPALIVTNSVTCHDAVPYINGAVVPGPDQGGVYRIKSGETRRVPIRPSNGYRTPVELKFYQSGTDTYVGNHMTWVHFAPVYYGYGWYHNMPGHYWYGDCWWRLHNEVIEVRQIRTLGGPPNPSRTHTTQHHQQPPPRELWWGTPPP